MLLLKNTQKKLEEQSPVTKEKQNEKSFLFISLSRGYFGKDFRKVKIKQFEHNHNLSTYMIKILSNNLAATNLEVVCNRQNLI